MNVALCPGLYELKVHMCLRVCDLGCESDGDTLSHLLGVYCCSTPCLRPISILSFCVCVFVSFFFFLLLHRSEWGTKRGTEEVREAKRAPVCVYVPLRGSRVWVVKGCDAVK